MNGKFLYLLMFTLNLVAIVIISAIPSNSPDLPSNVASGYVLRFFSISPQTIAADQVDNVTVSDGLTNATNAALTPATGVAQTGSLLGFIDVVRLVMAIVILIMSPAPFFAFLLVLNVPLVVVLLIGLPISFLSVISIMEFIRGSSL
jgi:hypothetical protein